MKSIKYLYNETGFTLIEALLTIVIVGIVAVPIATIYIGSFNEMIENEKMLVANQTSQLFLEYMKSRTYEELMDECFDLSTFDGDSDGDNDFVKVTDGDVELTSGHGLDLPEVPGEYTVELTIANGIIDGNSYDKPNLTTVPSADLQITFSSSTEYTISSSAGTNSYDSSSDYWTDPFSIEFTEVSAGTSYEYSVYDTDLLGTNGHNHNVTVYNSDSTINIISLADTDATYDADNPYRPSISIKANDGAVTVNQHYITDTTVKPSITTTGDVTINGITSYSENSDLGYYIYVISVTVYEGTEALTSISGTITER